MMRKNLEYQKIIYSTFQLGNILDINTKFIQDGHFSINNNSPLNHYSYYSNESICVNKSKNGGYIIENGEKLYIKGIDDSYDFNNFEFKL